MTDSQHDACCSRECGPCAAPLALAIMVALLLQFSAFSKIITANRTDFVPIVPKSWHVPEAWAQGGLEMLVVVGVLAAFRWRRTWQAAALFFAALGGFALSATIKNESCGCFGKVIELPRGFTLGMDIVLFLACLGMAAMLGVRRGAVIATMILALVAGGLGYAYQQAGSEPKRAKPVAPHTDGPGVSPEDRPPVPDEATTTDHTAANETRPAPAPTDVAGWWEARPAHAEGVPEAAVTLVEELPMTAPLRQGDADQTWYIFLHDPECEVCQAVKPDVEIAIADSAAQDPPAVRYIMIEIPELGRDFDMPYWVWNGTPTVLIVRHGAVLEEHHGEDVYDILPAEVERRVTGGEL